MSKTLQDELNFEVKRFIEQTDWDGYHQRVSFWLRRPSCPFYDGRDFVCLYWRGWILDGREFYDKTPEGERKYIQELRKESLLNIEEKVLREILATGNT